ncbi:MAG: ABC transporter substrate-binding protein, partial [Nisaea sp.]
MKTKLFAAALMAAGLGIAGEAIAKDSLMLGITLEPPHLDPTAGAAAAIDEVVYQNIFQGLTRIGPDGAVLPGLAKSWTVSDDGLTYRFALRDGVKFHDGTAFDSADVLFSIDRAMAEDSTNAQKGLFEAIAKVEASDANTVTITLKRPTGHFLFNLGWGDVVMVAPESADTNKTKPVGTGPFTFDRWSKGSEIRLTRNDAYWGDAAKLAKVSFKIMPDAASSAAALMSGDIDVFPNFGAPELLEQFRADPRFNVVVGTTEGETILSMNNTSKALSDIRVRRAIAHAIDRQAI